MATPLPYKPLLRAIGHAAAALGLDAYAVGGAVRDALLGRETTDLDVVAVGPGAGLALAEAAAGALGVRAPAVYPRFGTAALRVPAGHAAGDAERDLEVEFVGARKESYRAESRKPIVEDGTLADDLARRDFTVNALAASLAPDRFGDIVDPFGGLDDLRALVLRTPLDPGATFSDDPLRMLRAARFAAQLEFTVDAAALDAIAEHAERIAIVSAERIADELHKLLAADVPSRGLLVLHRTGLLDHVLPELARLGGVETVRGDAHKDVLLHTFDVVDNLAHIQRGRGSDISERAAGIDLWVRWAALLHDLAKPDTKRYEPGRGWTFHGHEDRAPREHIPALFRRLRLPLGEPLTRVQTLVRLHHRPTALVDADVTDSAVRRLLHDAGDDLEDLMELVRADVTSKNARRARRYLAGFDRVERRMDEVEASDSLRNFEPPVSGEEIMEALGLGEGVAVGILKTWVREAILDGEVPNEHDAAWAYVLDRKDEALRRGALFDRAVRTLRGPERRAIGAVKEALFWDDVPSGEAAHAWLDGVRDRALADG